MEIPVYRSIGYGPITHKVNEGRLGRVGITGIVSALPAVGATITVTNTLDSGAGSLRNAIATANPGDTINFSLTDPATITLSSTLTVGTLVEQRGWSLEEYERWLGDAWIQLLLEP